MEKINYWLRNIFVILFQYVGFEFGTKIIWYINDKFNAKAFYICVAIIPWVLVALFDINKKFGLIDKIKGKNKKQETKVEE